MYKSLGKRERERLEDALTAPHGPQVLNIDFLNSVDGLR